MYPLNLFRFFPRCARLVRRWWGVGMCRDALRDRDYNQQVTRQRLYAVMSYTGHLQHNNIILILCSFNPQNGARRQLPQPRPIQPRRRHNYVFNTK